MGSVGTGIEWTVSARQAPTEEAANLLGKVGTNDAGRFNRNGDERVRADFQVDFRHKHGFILHQHPCLLAQRERFHVASIACKKRKLVAFEPCMAGKKVLDRAQCCLYAMIRSCWVDECQLMAGLLLLLLLVLCTADAP